MRLSYVASALTAICGLVASGGCDSCEFRLLNRIPIGRGNVQSKSVIGCCGASVRQSVIIPEGSNRKVDLANTGFPTPVPERVDVWMTASDCEQLFAGTYPGSLPLCRTIVGPVGLDRVSDRVNVDAGTYRVFVQAYSSNASEFEYVADVGIWGSDCKAPSPTIPSLTLLLPPRQDQGVVARAMADRVRPLWSAGTGRGRGRH